MKILKALLEFSRKERLEFTVGGDPMPQEYLIVNDAALPVLIATAHRIENVMGTTFFKNVTVDPFERGLFKRRVSMDALKHINPIAFGLILMQALKDVATTPGAVHKEDMHTSIELMYFARQLGFLPGPTPSTQPIAMAMPAMGINLPIMDAPMPQTTTSTEAIMQAVGWTQEPSAEQPHAPDHRTMIHLPEQRP